MLAERAGVGIRLVTHPADVRLVRRVHMHVLLAVATVGEPPVAALELALKWLLTCMESTTTKVSVRNCLKFQSTCVETATADIV